MNSQDLGTAVRLNLNLVVVEDRAYGMIRWKQEVDKADVPDSAQYVRCRGGERMSSFHNI